VKGTVYCTGEWGEKGVEYAVKNGRSVTAIEVKTGKGELSPSGMDEFSKQFPPKTLLLIGRGGISLSQFLGDPREKWIAWDRYETTHRFHPESEKHEMT